MDSFTSGLVALGVKDLPSIPSAHPDQNPLDIFRTHIAERLAPLAGVDPEIVFGGLDRSVKPETGDFILAVPRLRIKGVKPDELAKKLQAQVRIPLYFQSNCSLDHHHYLKKSLQQEHSYNSSCQQKLLQL